MSPTPDELKNPVIGFLIYLGCLVLLMSFQSFSKLYLTKIKRRNSKGKKVSFIDTKYYNKDDVLALAGDRGFGNAHEQAIFFIPLYWLNALLVDDARGSLAILAAVYGFTRVVYPFLFLSKKFSFVFVSTVPGYIVLIYLLQGLVKFAL